MGDPAQERALKYWETNKGIAAMDTERKKALGEGGAKQRGRSLEAGENPALQKESRQAVKN